MTIEIRDKNSLSLKPAIIELFWNIATRTLV
jgi:hypothetical protein